jgi:catechol 2,3-dioxygenase-like lactoylglutathione lyase family enzyme
MRLDHVNVRCSRLDETVQFLERLVGLKRGWRPAFPFPGAWLYDDSGRAVVHLGQAGGEPGPAGAVDHIAFYFDDLAAQLTRQTSQGFPVELRAVPGTSIRQCFVTGPDGLIVEIQGPAPTASDDVAIAPAWVCGGGAGA